MLQNREEPARQTRLKADTWGARAVIASPRRHETKIYQTAQEGLHIISINNAHDNDAAWRIVIVGSVRVASSAHYCLEARAY